MEGGEAKPMPPHGLLKISFTSGNKNISRNTKKQNKKVHVCIFFSSLEKEHK